MDLYICSPIHLHRVVLSWLSTGTTLPLPDNIRVIKSGKMIWPVHIADVRKIKYCNVLVEIFNGKTSGDLSIEGMPRGYMGE
jgi:hypothetical protein